MKPRSSRSNARRATVAISLTIALALVASACSSGDPGADTTSGAGSNTTVGSSDFPDHPVRVILPLAPGGSADQVMREIQPYWEDRLGESFVIENHDGAGMTIGTQLAANAEADCYTIVWQLFPNVVMGYLTQDGLTYTYDDFYPLGNATYEPTILRVRNDSPYDTLQDLVDAALENPGELPGAVSSFNNFQYVAGLYLEEATGADFNMVPFGGSGSRTALISGEVEFVIAGVFNSLNIADETKVLAVFEDENEWPDLTDAAPTATEAVGSDIPAVPHLLFPMTNRGCKDNYPERFEVLESTFLDTLQSDDLAVATEEAGTSSRYSVMTADETDGYVRERIPAIEELISEHEEFSGGG